MRNTIMIRPTVLMLALLLAAPAANAYDDEVEIIGPPPRAVDRAKPAAKPIYVAVKIKTVVRVTVNVGWRRKPWRKWTGFQDTYSGPQYPF
jgi:hypothetical protein